MFDAIVDFLDGTRVRIRNLPATCPEEISEHILETEKFVHRIVVIEK